jgi:hypothetical protein
LQPQKVQNALHSLGVDAGNSAAPGFQPATSRTLEAGEERLNLCPTRIASVTWADGREVEESPSGIKRKWLAAFPRAAPREIGYLEVEKWLSQHCEVIAQLAEGVIVGADSAQRLAVVRYIDGSETVIDQTPQGLVKISQPGASARFYRSSDLKGALQELATIAQF